MSADPGAAAVDPALWAGRRVLLTGHTGFKGAWLALVAAALRAEVTGLSLERPTPASLFDARARARRPAGDVVADDARPGGGAGGSPRRAPEVVVHMAAQHGAPVVRRAAADL
jgi:CDP-glucose 4,6-dehydratase